MWWSARTIYASIGRRRAVRSSRLITRILFGVDVRSRNNGVLWDFTTLLFRRALVQAVKEGESVLEIGTGEVALLAIFLGVKSVTTMLIILMCSIGAVILLASMFAAGGE